MEMQRERGIYCRENYHAIDSPDSQMNFLFFFFFYTAMSVNSAK